ncbi:MAG: hypothetical protein ABIU54_09735 [Candidatus Eisenbacteria bacterium]
MPRPHSFLRHACATLGYRAAKAMRDASPGFASFQASPTSRTPLEILAHMGDLMDWALGMAAEGKSQWRDSGPLPWAQEVQRFHAGLDAFDRLLASGEELLWSPEVLFQGPIADALQHVGQLTFLRRLAGEPMKGESYARAEIVVGRVGTDQTPANVEFD